MAPGKRIAARHRTESRCACPHNIHQSADAHTKDDSHEFYNESTKSAKDCTDTDSPNDINHGFPKKMSDTPLDKNIEYSDRIQLSHFSTSRQDSASYNYLKEDFGHNRNGLPPGEQDALDVPNSTISTTDEHSRNIRERNTNRGQKSNKRRDGREIDINRSGEEHFSQCNYLGGFFSHNINDLSVGERDTTDIPNAATSTTKEHSSRNINERNRIRGEKSNRKRDEREIDINQGGEEQFSYTLDPYIPDGFVYNPLVMSPLYTLVRPQIPIPAAYNHSNQELPRIYPTGRDGNFWIANNASVFGNPLLYYPPGPANVAHVAPPVSYVQMTQFEETPQSDFGSTTISHSLNNVTQYNRSQTTVKATIRFNNLKEDECYNVKIVLTSSSDTKIIVNIEENEIEEHADLKFCYEDSRSEAEDIQLKSESNCSKNGESPKSISNMKRPSKEERKGQSGRAYISANSKSGGTYQRTHSESHNPKDERNLVQDRDYKVNMEKRSARERTGRDSYGNFSNMRPQSMQVTSPNYSVLPCQLPTRSRYTGQATRTDHRWPTRDLSDRMNRRSYTRGSNTSQEYENYPAYGQKVYRNSAYSDNLNNHGHLWKTPSPRPSRDFFGQETSLQDKFGPSDERNPFDTDTISRGTYEREKSQRQTDMHSHQKKEKYYRYEHATPPCMKTRSRRRITGYLLGQETPLQDEFSPSDEGTSVNTGTVSNGRYVVSMQPSYEYATEVGPSDERTSVDTDTISNGSYVVSMQPSYEYATEMNTQKGRNNEGKTANYKLEPPKRDWIKDPPYRN